MKLRLPGLNEPVTVKTASQQEIWSYVERLIAFEEPKERFERERKLLARHSGVPLKVLNKLPLETIESLSASVYSDKASPDHKEESLLSVVLALEDLRRFEPLVFKSWRFENVGQSIQRHKDLKWIEELPGTEDEHLWIEHAYNSAPQFAALACEGSWSKDARANFVVEALSALKNLEEPQKPTRVFAAQNAFRELLKKHREKLPGNCFPELVLLVEGKTEEIILPHLANCLGVNLNELGVFVTACGGAKQVAQRYLELRDICRLPLMVVLDNDADSESQVISEMLRERDRLHILPCGEIEDIFEVGMLIDLLNRHLARVCPEEPILVSDIQTKGKRTEILDRLWRKRGLGDFDKIGFAKIVTEAVISPQAVPADAKQIVNTIKELVKSNEA